MLGDKYQSGNTALRYHMEEIVLANYASANAL